jgi:hypothetical protein
MKSFAIAFALLASVSSFAQVVYSDAADLSSATTNHALVDAEFKMIATKIQTTEIAGCNPYAEGSPECTVTTVLERTPVIVVNVSYVDPTFFSDGPAVAWLSFNFKPSDFDAADVAALKNKGFFSKFGQTFAKKYFSLKVVNALRTISIVDVRNSKLCTVISESTEVESNCVESLVYKNATISVKEVNLIQK